MRLLLSQGSEVEPRSRLCAQTPLHLAASNRALRCAEALLPLMSSVDVTDQSGRTPLHHAAYSGDAEVTVTPEIISASVIFSSCRLTFSLFGCSSDGDVAPEQRCRPECEG